MRCWEPREGVSVSWKHGGGSVIMLHEGRHGGGRGGIGASGRRDIHIRPKHGGGLLYLGSLCERGQVGFRRLPWPSCGGPIALLQGHYLLWWRQRRQRMPPKLA